MFAKSRAELHLRAANISWALLAHAAEDCFPRNASDAFELLVKPPLVPLGYGEIYISATPAYLRCTGREVKHTQYTHTHTQIHRHTDAGKAAIGSIGLRRDLYLGDSGLFAMHGSRGEFVIHTHTGTRTHTDTRMHAGEAVLGSIGLRRDLYLVDSGLFAMHRSRGEFVIHTHTHAHANIQTHRQAGAASRGSTGLRRDLYLGDSGLFAMHGP